MIKTIKSAPKLLNALSATTIVLLLIKVFVFNKFQEPFHGFHEIGVVFEGLMASILASHIFYLIVVHLKEIKDKNNIYPHIIRWSSRVTGDCKSQLNEFSKASGITLDFDSLKESDLTEAMSTINPRGQAPLLLGASGNYATWMQYLENYRRRTKNYSSKVITQTVFMDSDLLSTIISIDDCNHFSAIEMLSNIPIGNSNLSGFSKSFFEYYKYCQTLNSLIEGKYSNFKQ